MAIPGVTEKKGGPNPGGLGPSPQDTPGGASPPGQGTPGDNPPAFSQEQVNQAVQQALTEAGRTEVSRQAVERDRETLIRDQGAHDTVMREWQNQEDARRMEAARDNPGVLDLIQEQRTFRDQKAAFAEEQRRFTGEKATFADRLANADQVEIRQMAVNDGVNPEILLSSSAGNVDAAKRLVGVLPKVDGGNGADQPKPGAVPSTFKPDSLVTVGGEGQTVRSMIDKAKGLK